jgi:hypothetical protein
MRLSVLDEPGPLLDAIYADILAPSFPVAELTPLEALSEGILRDAVDISCIVDDDGVPQAVAVGDWFDGPRVALLSYLATRSSVRSTGLGGQLLVGAVARWRDRWTPRLTVAEIEHPAANAATAEYGDPAARVRFYARHGVRPLALPYFQPQIRPGAGRVYGMMLCVLALSDDARGQAPDTVDGDVLTEFLVEYLEAAEGPMATDPAAVALLAAAGTRGGVPMLSFDDLESVPVTSPPA